MFIILNFQLADSQKNPYISSKISVWNLLSIYAYPTYLRNMAKTL